MLRASAVVAVLALVACGGDDAPPPDDPVGQDVEAATTDPVDAGAADGGQAADTTASQESQLVRETFSYGGAGRDPFISLVASGAVKPEPTDLTVVGIAYDGRYPQRSVATLRDRSDGTRYTLKPGDQVGRVRVQTIREREVVLIIEEFGLERQLVLSVSRRTREVNQ